MQRSGWCMVLTRQPSNELHRPELRGVPWQRHNPQSHEQEDCRGDCHQSAYSKQPYLIRSPHLVPALTPGDPHAAAVPFGLESTETQERSVAVLDVLVLTY